MAPLESRREPGPSDPAPAEAAQIQSEKPAPVEPADPECPGETSKKALKQKQRKKHAGTKTKKSRSSKKLEVVDSDSEASSDAVSSSDDSDDDESESEVELKKSKRLKRSDRRTSKKSSEKKGKKRAAKASSSESDSDDGLDMDEAQDGAVDDDPKNDKPKGQNEQQHGKQEINLQQQQQLLLQLILQGQAALAANQGGFAQPDPTHLQAALRSPFLQHLANTQLLQSTTSQPGRPETQPPKQGGSASQRARNTEGRRRARNKEVDVEKVSVNGLEYKRVDQVWDSSIHNYKLKDTTQSSAGSKYEGFLFHVRRTFDWEGKYKTTYVDIKSKELRESIREVIGDIKGVSLVEETPKLDPNLLFL